MPDEPTPEEPISEPGQPAPESGASESGQPAKDFEQLAKEAAYVAVGFGVLGLQKAQVVRRELAEALAARGRGPASPRTDAPAASAPAGPAGHGPADGVGAADAPAEHGPGASAEHEAIDGEAPAERRRDLVGTEARGGDRRAQGAGGAGAAGTEGIGAQFSAAAQSLRPQIDALGITVADMIRTFERRSAPARAEMDARLAEIQDRVPGRAGAAVAGIRVGTAMSGFGLRWVAGQLAPDRPSDRN